MIVNVVNKENQITLLELLKENYFSKDLIKKLKHTYDMYKLISPYESIDIILPEEDTTVEPNILPIDIVYEDDYILVVNKPKDLSTIPSIRHFHDNLASSIKNYYDLKGLKAGLHFINRLDKDTQGLVLVAKHQYIQSLFVKKEIEISKKYYALVESFSYDEIIVEQPISRYEDTNKRCIDPNGDYAKTKFNKVCSLLKYDLVEATLYTGRTHQIRVHLQYLNSPIIGDELYGNKEGEFFLMSYYLGFNHPVTDKYLEFKLDL